MTGQPIAFFDGHNDTLLRRYRADERSPLPFLHGSPDDIDLPRARQGNFVGGLFACFVPNDPELSYDETDDFVLPPAPRLGYAQHFTIGTMAMLFRIEAESQGAVRVVRDTASLDAALNTGALAAVLHIEGADAIDAELDALEVFYQAGLRSLGIVWSRPNAFGTGVPFAFPHGPDTGPGLTDAGIALVRACEEHRILIDLSHLNEQGFWDVAKTARAPLLATHSNAHAICPSPRNLTDRQLDAVRDSGGMVGVNFHVGFLRPDGARESATSLDIVVDHVDHLVAKLGIDHVGLGSDYDGARMPNDIATVDKLPALAAALRARGYDDAALRKIASENWLRLLRTTWA